MKTFRLISVMVAAMALALGCQPKDDPIEDIIVSVNPTTLSMESAAAEQTVQLTATRAWKATVTYEGTAADWLMVSPASGKASRDPQTVTLTAKENSGRDRVAKVKFSIGLDDATLTVTQKGPGGSADPVYFNDFDKSAAVKDGNYWPYVYQTDCWQNEKGTGIAGITYVTEGNKATVRNNSNSPASGVNNWFFGSGSLFCVKDITLPSSRNFTLSFYGVRNVYNTQAGDGKSVFDHKVFKVYVSADTKKWVELEYAFANGDPDNTWDLATSTFTVPAGVEKLSIYIPGPSETSTYRLDDLKIDVSDTAGKAIDFTTGQDITVGGDDPVGPGEEGKPSGTGTEADPFNPTAAIAKAKEIGETGKDFYYIKGFISDIKEVETAQHGNATFNITDTKAANTGKFCCYQVMYLGGEKFTSDTQIKVGDEVTVYGQIVNYKGNTPETSGKGSGRITAINGQKEKAAEEITTEKVSEAIAASENSKVTLKNVVVVANSPKGYLVTDGTDFILTFFKTLTDPAPAIGDKVNLTGTKSTYGGMPQIVDPATTKLSSGSTVTYPEAQDISATLDSFTSTSVKYVSFRGKLTISGSYYNVAVAGASVIGCFIEPSIDVKAYAGVDGVVYEGYYIYTTTNATSKFVYLILTKAAPGSGPYFSASCAAASVAATASTAEINVTSNVDWTASSDNAAFTLDKTSGTGDGTIKVTVAENTAYEARSAKVTVSTTASVTTKSYEITITQAAAQDPSMKVVELTNAEITASFAASTQTSDVYGNWTVPSTSGSWTGNMNTKKDIDFVQIRNSMNAHILTPEFSSAIAKIEVTACATISSSGTNEQSRDLYAIPVDVDLNTPDTKTKFAETVISGAYAGPANFKGASKVEITQTLDLSAAGVKQCKLISFNGALYIKSIKVYLK